MVEIKTLTKTQLMQLIQEEYYILLIETHRYALLAEVFAAGTTIGTSGKNYGSNMDAKQWATAVLNNPNDFYRQDLAYAQDLQSKNFVHPADTYGPSDLPEPTNRMLELPQTLKRIERQWADWLAAGGDIRGAIDGSKVEGQDVIQILRGLASRFEAEKKKAHKRYHDVENRPTA
tara:strand:- start:68 stop:592 length:525 start_codon:yes stop_codon:yes gene_type:complete